MTELKPQRRRPNRDEKVIGHRGYFPNFLVILLRPVAIGNKWRMRGAFSDGRRLQDSFAIGRVRTRINSEPIQLSH